MFKLFLKHIPTFSLFFIFALNTQMYGQMSQINVFVLKSLEQRANKKFDKLAYAKAIELYEKTIHKGDGSIEVKRKLALSYFKTIQPKKAESLFSEIVSSDKADTMDYYHYAQVLKYNEKYEEADFWINKYTELQSDDSRGRLQYKSAPVIKQMRLNEKFKIESVSYNSKFSDFGAVEFQGMVYFTTARKQNSIIDYKYAWKEDPYLDLYVTRKYGGNQKKQVKRLSKGLNSRYHDGPLCFGKGGKTVYVTRSNFKMGIPLSGNKKVKNFKIYSAERKGIKWGALKPMNMNSNDYSCGHPALSADNKTMYFASNMPGGYGGSDIYSIHKSDSGWTEPVNLGPSVNTEGDEMFPFENESGDLFFTSNGHMGLGGLDIFMATPIGEEGYGILNLGYPLNSSSDDFSFFLTRNEMEGYFASNRDGGKGDDDIYKFLMLEQPSFFLNLIVTFKNEQTGEIISGADILIVNEKGKEVYRGKTNSLGQVESLVVPEMRYNISFHKSGFEGKTETVLCERLASEDNLIKFGIEVNSY